MRERPDTEDTEKNMNKGELRKALVTAFAAMACAVAGCGLAATDPTPNRSLAMTLDECVRAAIEENPQYRAAIEGTVSASEAADAAKAPYYPDLSFTMAYQRFQTHIFLPNSLDLPLISPIVGPIDSNGVSVSATYTLFDSGARKAVATQGRMGMEASLSAAAQSREEVAFGVHRAFFALLAAQEEKGVAFQSLKRTEEHLRLAEARKAAGAVPLADVLRARVEVGNARLSLVQAEGDLAVSRGSLNTAMGRSPDSPLQLVAPDGEALAPESSSAEAEFERALDLRPELKSASSRVEARRSAVALARSAYGPKLLALARYGRLDSDFFPQDEDWAIGVTLQIPLYNYGRSHALARARSELTQEELGRKKLELSIRQEVWNARADVDKAWSSIEAAKALAADAEESLRMAKERYAAGAGTVTDLLDAETNMARSALALVSADYTYRVALSALKKAMGELTP